MSVTLLLGVGAAAVVLSLIALLVYLFLDGGRGGRPRH
jgi:hypothetical protein